VHVDSKSYVIFKIPIKGAQLLSVNYCSKTKGPKIFQLLVDPAKKTKLTADNCQEIMDHLSLEVTPTLEQCRQFLSKKEWDMSAKQLQDKVRYLFKKAN